MKTNKNLFWIFLVLIIIVSLYRIIPGRPYGFAPQWAMGVFAGAVIRNKKLAVAMPVLSMLFSDILFQILYSYGLSSLPGFYDGQWQNYILFGMMSFVGMALKKVNVVNVLVAALAAPTIYFVLSNLVLWAGWSGTRGLGRPKSFEGLILCYGDALPFYWTSLMATVVFSAVLFGGFFLVRKSVVQTATA